MVDMYHMYIIHVQPPKKPDTCAHENDRVERHEAKECEPFLWYPGSVRFLLSVSTVDEILRYASIRQTLIDTSYRNGDAAASVIVRVYDADVDHDGETNRELLHCETTGIPILARPAPRYAQTYLSNALLRPYTVQIARKGQEATAEPMVSSHHQLT